MAELVMCDRCEKVLPKSTESIIKIKIVELADGTLKQDIYPPTDLCESCLNGLRRFLKEAPPQPTPKAKGERGRFPDSP